MVENKILCLSGKSTPAFGGTVNRKALQPAEYGSKTAVQDWLSPTGLTRSLPTNIRDIPHTINTNSIRSKRVNAHTGANMGEGGKTYSPITNIDNFVEDRSDKAYSHASVPSIVRCKKMYQTEAMERQNEALPAYKEALAAQGLAAKVVPNKDHASRQNNSDYIGYATEGFGRGTAQRCGDATAKHAQGAAWVGIAPVHNLKTVSSTMLSGKKAEFQKNHPSASGRVKVVVGCTKDGLPPPSAMLDKAMETCRAGEVHARQWKSMYQTEICRMG